MSWSTLTSTANRKLIEGLVNAQILIGDVDTLLSAGVLGCVAARWRVVASGGEWWRVVAMVAAWWRWWRGWGLGSGRLQLNPETAVTDGW